MKRLRHRNFVRLVWCLRKRGCEVEQSRYLETISGKFCGAKLVKIAWRDKISDLNDDAIFVAKAYTGELTGMPRMQHVA